MTEERPPLDREYLIRTARALVERHEAKAAVAGIGGDEVTMIKNLGGAAALSALADLVDMGAFDEGAEENWKGPGT